MQTFKQENGAAVEFSVDRLADLVRWTTVCSKALGRLFSDELAEFGITLNEFILLWTCQQNQDFGLSQNDLAALTGSSTAQLSQIAEQLRQKGWILASRCKSDRRRQTLSLTPDGIVVLRGAFERLREPTRKLVRDSASWLHGDAVAVLRQVVFSIDEVARAAHVAGRNRSQASSMREAA